VIAMFPLHTHLKMLADRHRMATYKKGIFENIRPGDIVADIGTGTGILSFLALQAGAARVYAIESGDIIATARKVAADNGLMDKVVFINTDSREANLPEKVDVILTETFGGMGIDEGAIEMLADARNRFLKPGGRLLPASMNLWALPVQFDLRHPLASITDPFDDLATDSLMELAVNTHYGLRSADLEGCRPIGTPGQLFSWDFSSCRPLEYPVEMQLPDMALTGGECEGVVLYPELLFPGQTSLTLFDGSHFVPTHWELVFFPIRASLKVDRGDNLSFHLTVTRSSGVVWKYVLNRKGEKKVFTHLSAFGRPSLKGALPG